MREGGSWAAAEGAARRSYAVNFCTEFVSPILPGACAIVAGPLLLTGFFLALHTYMTTL